MVWPSREKFLFIKKLSSKSFACLQKPVALIVKTLMKPLVGVKDCSLTYHKVNHSRPSTHKRRAITNNSKKQHLFHIIHGIETILETDSTVKAVQKRLMFIEHSTYHLWKILIIGCYYLMEIKLCKEVCFFCACVFCGACGEIETSVYKSLNGGQ